jgi:GTP-binding protein
MTATTPTERVWPAEFVLGTLNAEQFPADDRPEIAFVGRSNVGKSSLLNRLLNRRSLARVSKTPGCTREVLFFHVDQRWWFVDLPGYGFARVDRRQQAVWERGVGNYVSQRRNLRAIVLLFDVRRGMTPLDVEMVNYLQRYGLPFLPVANKMDQIGTNAGRQARAQLGRQLEAMGALAITGPVGISCFDGTGIEGLRQTIRTVLETTPAPEGPGTGTGA